MVSVYILAMSILSNTERQDAASAGKPGDLTPVERAVPPATSTGDTRGVQCTDTITDTVQSIDIFIKMHVQYVIITYFKLRKTIYIIA